MYKMIKTALAVFSFALCLLGAILLPSVLTALTDRTLTSDINFVTIEESFLFSNPQLSTLEKLQLLESAEETDFISVSSGSNLTYFSIETAIKTELSKLMELEILPEFEPEYIWLDNGIYFVMKPDSPDKNMIIWARGFASDNLVGTALIDDETGMILQCFVRASSVDPEFSLTRLVTEEQWAMAWSEYLDIPLVVSSPIRKGLLDVDYGTNGNIVTIPLQYSSELLSFGRLSYFSILDQYVMLHDATLMAD